VRMSQMDLATIAFHALLNEIAREQDSHEHSEYELNTSLVIRRSTALAPARRSATNIPKANRAGESRKKPTGALR